MAHPDHRLIALINQERALIYVKHALIIAIDDPSPLEVHRTFFAILRLWPTCWSYHQSVDASAADIEQLTWMTHEWSFVVTCFSYSVFYGHLSLFSLVTPDSMSTSDAFNEIDAFALNDFPVWYCVVLLALMVIESRNCANDIKLAQHTARYATSPSCILLKLSNNLKICTAAVAAPDAFIAC